MRGKVRSDFSWQVGNWGLCQKVIFHDEWGRGVSQKVIFHDEGGGRGVETQPKKVDIICEQSPKQMSKFDKQTLKKSFSDKNRNF